MSAILHIIRHFGFALLLCGVGIIFLCNEERYVDIYRHRAQKAQQQLHLLQQTEKRLQILSTLFDPHQSPFLGAITRLQRTSSITFEKNVAAIALLAGVTHVTLQSSKDRPSAVILDVRGDREETVLNFLRGLEEVCLCVPYIEKIVLTGSSKEGMHAQLRLVRFDGFLPIEIEAPYVLPSSLEPTEFHVFSHPSPTPENPRAWIEGYMSTPKGRQIAISGKWLRVGDHILHCRVKEIDSHGVYLENNHQIYYIEIGSSLLCQQDPKEPKAPKGK
jgi:hypothetical protein